MSQRHEVSALLDATAEAGSAGRQQKSAARWRPGRLLVGLALASLAAFYAGRRTAALGPSAPQAAARPQAVDGGAVALSAGSTARNPVTTSRVSKLVLGSDLETIGAAAFDGDRYAVVGPLEHGRVASIRVRPGMEVRAGQVLAEIESAEVGQAQAAYLSAAARRVSSQANLRRETELADRHVSSGRERELAEAQAASDEAELRAARQRLLALGLVRAEIEALAAGSNRAGRVALRAPIDGTVITRSITLGQAVEAATDAFHIADLSRLWVQLDIFEKDVPYVYVGQKADLRTDAWPGEVFAARVAHIEPLIDEHTRTARVRIEFDNLERRLRPGQFVTAHLRGEAAANGRVVLAVPRSAVMTIDGRKTVFAEAAAGHYLRRPVELGRVGGELVEVRSGVSEGESVVSDGAFLLKSELAR